MFTRRTLLGAVGVGASATIMAGCRDDSAESPEGAARLIARSLESGTPSTGPISGSSVDKAYDLLTADLKMKPAVSVVSVHPDASSGAHIAKLRYTWDFGSQERWEYEVEADLLPAGRQWSAMWSPALVHPDLTRDDVLQLTRGVGNRGEILDRDGKAIVTRRPVVVVGLDKSTLGANRHESSARRLAKVLDLDPDTYVKTVTAYGPKAFVEAITLRTGDLPLDKRRAIDEIPGVNIIDGERDLAPSKAFARPVLGAVAPATAEQVAASKGRLRAGDAVGTGGLQEQYDSTLKGRRVTAVRAVPVGNDTAGASRLLYKTPQADGQPLRTSLSQDLQARAEELLAQHEDKPTALVAIKPSTGEILAVASGPGSKDYDTARQGRYAPGSTFKVVSSLALLRTGHTLDGTVNCTPTTRANGREYHNFPDYPSAKLGSVPFKTALANSCNTVMIRGASQASASDLAAAADSLGMTQDIGHWGFTGSVPSNDTGAEHDSSMIGQGRLLASPLGMATVMASVVSGQRVTPHLVPQDKPSPAAPKKPLTAAETRDLRSLTRAVVTEGGGRILSDIAGPPVLAKTGTAEYGNHNPPRVHSWMIAAQGDLAVAVLVEDGGYGSVTCGPIIRGFLQSAR